MWGGKMMDELKVSHSGSRVENKRQCGCLPSCCRVRRYVLFYNPLDRSLKLNALSAKRTDGQWKGGRNWNSTQSSEGSISSVVRKSEFFCQFTRSNLNHGDVALSGHCGQYRVCVAVDPGCCVSDWGWANAVPFECNRASFLNLSYIK